MKKRVHFFQSVNFKIALTFILILLISIEIIGAYFIRGLEKSTIENFKANMNAQAETLAGTIGTHLGKKSDPNNTTINDEIQRILDNSDSPDIIETRVVDEKGIVRATTNPNDRNTIGKKNEDTYINDFVTKSIVAMKQPVTAFRLTFNRLLRPEIRLLVHSILKVILSKNIKKLTIFQLFL